MITDLVFWFILYPFLARNEYEMNFVSNHFINFEYYVSIQDLKLLYLIRTKRKRTNMLGRENCFTTS
jgi:hypothetical protein